jgi:predicted Zn-dependent protease
MSQAQEPEKDFRKGKKYFRDNDMDRATRAFEKAYRSNRENPKYMSYYGMCAALRWGQIGLGLELCTKAVKNEFYKAEYYVNLGRVYMAAGNKKGGITVIKKGLRQDPENDELHEMLIELGVRKRPMIPFLKRSSPLNRLLGVIFRRTIPNILRKKRPRGEEEADVGF